MKPFTQYELADKIKMINDWGKKNNPQYVCVNANYRRSANRHLYVLIKNVESNETKEVKFAQLKRINPFSRGKNQDYFIQKTVNELGLNQKYQYQCINPNVKVKNKSKRCVEIQCLRTNKKHVVFYHSLVEGKNPFNQDINREEINKVQPMYERLFKKLNITYEKEFRLNKNSIIDFKIKLPNKQTFDLVEVKQSKRFNSSNNQLQRYKKLAKLKQHKVDSIYFSDPQGKHKNKGFVSINELKKILVDQIGGSL